MTDAAGDGFTPRTEVLAHPPVDDWATDFDHTTDGYAADAPQIWDDLRERCPVARTERFGGAWLPTLHSDVSAIAHDTEHFTSHSVIVSDWRPESPPGVGFAPPITSDPPFHKVARGLLLPAFAPRPIQALEPDTRRICDELLDDVLATIAAAEPATAVVDAAAEYAQHIPVRVIAKMLGVPESDGDRFRRFIHRILEKPGQVAVDEGDTMWEYLLGVVEQHRDGQQSDDLVSYLMNAEIGGRPLDEDHVVGTIALLLIAGIDTTWSAIGASLFHLATHPEDQARLRSEPALLPTAVEELLRYYSPVTMARIVKSEVEVGGASMTPGEWVLLSFPAANRDPEAFDDADRVLLDRERNRHCAFGLGIHRCVGSNLARLELTVALERWLARAPTFELADPESVRWSSGQVRGPRELPLRFET